MVSSEVPSRGAASCVLTPLDGHTHPDRCCRSTWPIGLGTTVGCSTCLPKPETLCDNKTQGHGHGLRKPHKMQSSHIKVSSSSPQAQFSPVENPRPVCRHRRAAHPRPRLSVPASSASVHLPHTHPHLHITGGRCVLNVCQPYVLSRSRLLSVHSRQRASS